MPPGSHAHPPDPRSPAISAGRTGIPGAVILAGGRASRLGGFAKPLATAGGRTLLDLAIGAVPGGSEIVVVGPPELRVPSGVLLVREDPPFGGPVAALAAGVAALSQPTQWLLALAADQPTVGASVVILLAAERAHDGVIGLDGTGRRQPLAALYRADSVREPLCRSDSPRRLMDLASALSLSEVFLGERLDVDTPDDARHFGVRMDRAHRTPEGRGGLDRAHDRADRADDRDRAEPAAAEVNRG